MNFSSRVTMLEKIQEKYKMNQDIYREAKKTLFLEEAKQSKKLDLSPFFKNFPRSLRKDLKYSVYSRDFQDVYFSKHVDPIIVNCIGDAMKNIKIPASIPLTHRTIYLPSRPSCREHVFYKGRTCSDDMGSVRRSPSGSLWKWVFFWGTGSV
jgi:hypothetical protein